MGTATVVLTDPLSGNSGQSDVVITNAQTSVTANVAASAAGPSVASVSPADGATAVPLVASIVVQFTKPLSPGTLGTNGIQLLGTNGQPVGASLTLNLKNTIATLLPTSQLAANTLLTVLVSTNIADAAGLPLAGRRTFTFTTETDLVTRDPTAQLISYEPVNGIAGVVGTPGLADPQSPVIIVNETSGRTATAVSDVDGSFTNSIQAEVDDMLSATLVNKNGTRNSVTLSRQIFQDGSVGLFNSGGTIEAQTPEGSLQLAIEPGAISGKSKLKLDFLTLAQVQTVASNTPPEGGASVIGGFKVSMDGPTLKVGAHVSFPIKESDLNLAPGDSASNHVFAMCEPVVVDGVTVYRVVDSMAYEGGNVVSHSPPFDGLADIPLAGMAVAMVMYPFNMAQKMAVVGSVVVATDTMYDFVRTNGAALAIQQTNPGVRLLPDAWVNAYPPGVFETHSGLTPGTFVAMANSAGRFAYLLPFNPFQGSGYLLAAQSPLFPDQIATRSASASPLSPLATVDLIFRVPDNGSGRVNTTPPIITANPPGLVLPTNQTVSIDFLISDNLGKPRFDLIFLVPAKSFSLLATNVPVTPLDPAKVTLNQSPPPQDTSDTSIRAPVDFLVTEPAIVTVQVRAVDADLNFEETQFTFYFGAAPGSLPGKIVSADTNDTTPPQVVWTLPPQGAYLDWGSALMVSFSKAVDPSITNGLGIAISGSTAPLHIELSDDQLGARIYPADLQPGTNYTLTINNSVKDLNGIGLDQDPTTSTPDPFKLVFKTPPAPITTLPLLGRPVGTLVFQTRAFTLDTYAPNVGPAIVVHQLGASISVLTNIVLPSPPRAMTLIPEYNFARGYTTPAESKPLLVVIGGTIGTGGDGQWIRLYDISMTNEVDRIGSAFLTTDQDSSAANVKFSAPNLFVHIFGAGGSYIQVINLQALILGCNLPYDTTQWPTNALPYQMISGVDTNNDGDYTDPGEKLPIPQKYGLFGLVQNLVAAPGRDFTDFDVQGGGAFLSATMMGGGGHPSRLQVILDSGMMIGVGDDALGAYEFPSDVNAFRVALDLDFPVPNSMGGKKIHAALVSAGQFLYILDLTTPQAPTLLNTLKLADNPGTISSIVRSGSDEYTIGAANSVLVLQRSLMAQDFGTNNVHPSVRLASPLPASGRALGISPAYYSACGGPGAHGCQRLVHAHGRAVRQLHHQCRPGT